MIDEKYYLVIVLIYNSLIMSEVGLLFTLTFLFLEMVCSCLVLYWFAFY